LLQTEEAKALCEQRKTIVEPVFGHIKQQRGIREFRLRGLKKTKAEWLLICLTHNLLKLYRHDWLPKRTKGGPESPGQPEKEAHSSPRMRRQPTPPSNRQSGEQTRQDRRHRCLHGPSRRPRPKGLG
jgi:hypothetical protein